MNTKEKAAFLVGMVRAFDASTWPTHFNVYDISAWRYRCEKAHQILDNQIFHDPMDIFVFMDIFDIENLVDDELRK